MLEIDFLERYGFLTDNKKRHLTLKETSKYTKGRESHITSLNLVHTPPVTTAKVIEDHAGITELLTAKRYQTGT